MALTSDYLPIASTITHPIHPNITHHEVTELLLRIVGHTFDAAGEFFQLQQSLSRLYERLVHLAEAEAYQVARQVLPLRGVERRARDGGDADFAGQPAAEGPVASDGILDSARLGLRHLLVLGRQADVADVTQKKERALDI